MNDDYIAQRIDDQIGWLGGKAAWNQRRFKRARLAEIALSSLIPILVLLPMEDIWGRVLVASVGATIGVIAGAATLGRYQELWVQYRATTEALNREKVRYRTGVPPYNGTDRFVRLVDRIETLFGDENAAWTERTRPAATPPPS